MGKTDRIEKNTDGEGKGKGKGKKGLISKFKEGVCEILDDKNHSNGVNIGSVKINKPNRKGKGVSKHFKDGLHGLDDN